LSSPIEDLLNFAHRSYVRMEAEQLIQDCLVREDMEPFNQMVEGLVLDGIHSMPLLQEVLGEVRKTKAILTQEGLGVRQDLMNALAEFGVHLPQILYTDIPGSLHKLTFHTKQFELDAKNLSEDKQELLEEIWTEAGERVVEVARRLQMISSIEDGIRDWIGSLAYDALRSEDSDSAGSQDRMMH
jgi:hypothetical protein